MKQSLCVMLLMASSASGNAIKANNNIASTDSTVLINNVAGYEGLRFHRYSYLVDVSLIDSAKTRNVENRHYIDDPEARDYKISGFLHDDETIKENTLTLIGNTRLKEIMKLPNVKVPIILDIELDRYGTVVKCSLLIRKEVLGILTDITLENMLVAINHNFRYSSFVERKLYGAKFTFPIGMKRIEDFIN